MKTIDLSFVIPAKNEEGSVEKLYLQILSEVKKLKKSYEIIFIDDGSTDKTFEVLSKLRKKDKRITIIRHRGNWGKSVALQNGFDTSRGEIVFTMDADLQDNPVEIKKFLKKLDLGYDLVSGWKKKRHDPISKVVPSRILNLMISKFIRVPIHDTNCGYKAYRKCVVKDLMLYGELYRFIPVLAAKKNYRVGEIVVRHRARKYGSSKYGWERNVKGFLDFLTIIFLTGYARRPAHFFGTLGLVSFIFG